MPLPDPEVRPFAVLMDASAVFFAVRDLYEGQQLDYSKLAELLSEKTGVRRSQPQPSRESSENEIWAMWTSFHPQNTGQARFLEYAEGTLGWAVRRVDPSDSYIVDPQTTLGISKSPEGGASRVVNRLIRFDGSIAYSIGRLASKHKIVLVSDSYALAEPLIRSAVVRRERARRSGLRADRVKNYIAFFGRLLDPRWLPLFRSNAQDHLEFIDLEDASDKLFGSTRSMYAWNDDFPIR